MSGDNDERSAAEVAQDAENERLTVRAGKTHVSIESGQLTGVVTKVHDGKQGSESPAGYVDVKCDQLDREGTNKVRRGIAPNLFTIL